MRTFVMGDIHGAHRAMVQCLEGVGFDKEEDRLIFIGDFCDGYSESYQVLRELASVKKLVWIVGNHDHKFFRYVDEVVVKDGLISTANLTYEESRDGDSTLTSFYENDGWEWLKQNLDYLKERQRLGHEIEVDGSLPLAFVHGGIPFARGLGSGDLAKDAGKSVMYDRSMYEETYNRIDSNIHSPVNKQYSKVYIGHTPTRSGGGMDLDMAGCRVVEACGVVMMDTGAGWGGPLAIRDIDTGETFYSQPAKELYPNEKGRDR